MKNLVCQAIFFLLLSSFFPAAASGVILYEDDVVIIDVCSDDELIDMYYEVDTASGEIIYYSEPNDNIFLPRSYNE